MEFWKKLFDSILTTAVTTSVTSELKKKAKTRKAITIAAAVIVLVGFVIFTVSTLSDKFDGNDTSEEIASETIDHSKFDDEKQIDSIVSEAEALAAEGNYKGALAKVQAGLVTYPKSLSLQNKAKEYEDSYVGNIVAQIDTYREKGNLDVADQIISEALKQCPNNVILKKQQERIKNAKPQSLLEVCPPYQTSRYNTPTTFKMAGSVYTNGFTLDCHGGSALFNLDGQYNKLEFDLGYTDSDNRAECNINIYLDKKLIKNIVMGYEDLPKHFVVPLDGASQLKIENVNYGNTAVYGFANVMVCKNINITEYTSDEKPEILSDKDQYLLSVCPPYQTSRYNTPTTFKMAGSVYTNGFTLDCHGGSALFNLNEQYNKLEFDLGYTDSDNRAECNINIYLDKKLIKNIVMGYEDLPKHFEISLDGASQLKIENVNYGNTAVYGFANAIIY